VLVERQIPACATKITAECVVILAPQISTPICSSKTGQQRARTCRARKLLSQDRQRLFRLLNAVHWLRRLLQGQLMVLQRLRLDSIVLTVRHRDGYRLGTGQLLLVLLRRDRLPGWRLLLRLQAACEYKAERTSDMTSTKVHHQ